MTTMPDRYPVGFAFPPGVVPTTADYFGRGWCFCESSVANIVRPSTNVLDLGLDDGSRERFGGMQGLLKACTAQRAPPLTPSEFREALASKAFTSKKADEEMVGGLYEAQFTELMGKTSMLDCNGLGWGDAEVTGLAKALGEGAEQLTSLWLGSNQIGDAGLAALVDAGLSGGLRSLQKLVQNRICDAGVDHLVDAIRGGALPALVFVELSGNPASNADAVKDALAARKE
jgi:hypothetical protein